MSLKELDKFVRHFVLKSVQIIVQSRLGSPRVVTQCNPRGNDWFNLAIIDLKDINEQTKRCLQTITSECEDEDKTSILVTNSWKVCCEISLKTNEGQSIILEYWLIANELLDEKNDPQSASTAAPLVIYNIYNRMSLMLKSIISLTRATPAYKLSSRGQSAESYVICYRVYQCDGEFDVGKNQDEERFFSPLIKLGSIKSAYNELQISFAYRTDMTLGCKNVQQNNPVSLPKSPQLMPVKKDHFKSEDRSRRIEQQRDPHKPLMGAFATSHTSISTKESITRIRKYLQIFTIFEMLVIFTNFTLN